MTTKTMAFVSSISYNPTGSGNRDHAAFVGIDAVDQKVKVWVQNTSTGATSAAVTQSATTRSAGTVKT
jgi:hypothetical protein